MSKLIDLTGQKFGRLTVIEFSHNDKGGRTCWLCICDCGKETVVQGGNLKSGGTKSCGCLQKETRKIRLDLTGQKFGRLKVIEFFHINRGGKACWLCKCNCGNEKIIQSDSLKRGNTKSCGCLQKETLKKIQKRMVDNRRFPEGLAARNRVIRTHKINAKKSGIEQALTDDQIIAIHKENCHYCGTSPSNVCSTRTGLYTYNGIDRVDNKKGYTIDNVVSCCWDCNRDKGKLSYKEFLNRIKRIHSHLNL